MLLLIIGLIRTIRVQNLYPIWLKLHEQINLEWKLCCIFCSLTLRY
ncbi:hypothetical protein Zm00014a_010015 [Zea mays]|uniref:Uncharacterized protein n=1 Tax=Zea mays TaxID=4577 RepID=A0A3L6DNV2_MAIZE|nr:hypothetical protein Zm00014a_010015 [Zea mays]